MKLFRIYNYVNLKDTLPTALKSIAAIILLGILLFNFAGYRFIAEFVQMRYDNQLEATLDNQQYNENELTELRIPLHAAYQSNSLSYERTSGEITIEGVDYQYVKRKVFNDTLYLKCIKNTMKMHVENAKNEFFKITNDIQGANAKNSEHSKTVLKVKLINEYNGHSFPQLTNHNVNLLSQFFFTRSNPLLTSLVPPKERPPESTLS